MDYVGDKFMLVTAVIQLNNFTNIGVTESSTYNTYQNILEQLRGPLSAKITSFEILSLGIEKKNAPYISLQRSHFKDISFQEFLGFRKVLGLSLEGSLN